MKALKRVLIINDFDPLESPGAASVAANFPKLLNSKETEFFFVGTSKSRAGIYRITSATMILKQLSLFDKYLEKIRKRLGVFDTILRLFYPKYFFFLSRILLTYNIDVVWIHQIGNQFPHSLVLLAKLFRKRIVWTFHDFSLLRYRKLYAGDFVGILEETEKAIESISLHTETNYSFVIRDKSTLAQRITRYFASKSDVIVYISRLQRKVYTDNGFSNGEIIGNIVDRCSCELTDSNFKDSGKAHILYAGRLVGKGLDLLCKEISQESKLHLHVAGTQEVADFISENLSKSQFTYHGFISGSPLMNLIHNVDLVAVLSNCLDVYPTITLEAMAHGTPVVTTIMTGNSSLVRALSDELVWKANSNENLRFLCRLKSREDSKFALRQIQECITNSELIKPYLVLLNEF